MSTLTGKIALVTGASKGIGAGIAKHLGMAGATVIVNYATSQAGADKVVAEIEAAGGHAEPMQGDFSKLEDIHRVYAHIKQQHGHLDVLVNNAGIYDMKPLDEVTPESFMNQFRLNVMGLLFSTQAAVRIFNPAGGSVINIGSVVGAMPVPNASVYCGTKGAVDAISISLAKELGPKKIRVNALNPGMVETEGTADFIGWFHEAVKGIPLGRIGQPHDIGKVAAFLASDESYWLTGQLINAAGGQTM